MFHDIFKKSSARKKSKSHKYKIIVDVHEKNCLVLSELVSDNSLDISLEALEIGDYLVGDFVIERKTTNDLYTSIINRRIFDQLDQLKNCKSLLLIEGDLDSLYLKDKKARQVIKGFILSLLTKQDIRIIFSKDHIDTAGYLSLLSKKERSSPLSFHSRIPKDRYSQKKYVLESFPGIGPKRSEALLKKFRSLKNVFDSEESSLVDVLKEKSKDFISLLEDNNDY